MADTIGRNFWAECDAEAKRLEAEFQAKPLLPGAHGPAAEEARIKALRRLDLAKSFIDLTIRCLRNTPDDDGHLDNMIGATEVDLAAFREALVLFRAARDCAGRA